MVLPNHGGTGMWLLGLEPEIFVEQLYRLPHLAFQVAQCIFIYIISLWRFYINKINIIYHCFLQSNLLLSIMCLNIWLSGCIYSIVWIDNNIFMSLGLMYWGRCIWLHFHKIGFRGYRLSQAGHGVLSWSLGCKQKFLFKITPLNPFCPFIKYLSVIF